MLRHLLVANLLHGLVAAAWIVGLERWAGPLPAATRARLHTLALALPVVLALGGLGRPPPDGPEGWRLLRADRWVQALTQTPGLGLAVLALLLGTLAVFLLQDLLPVLVRKPARLQGDRQPDPRLQTVLARVQAAFARHGLALPPIEVACLEVPQPLAALERRQVLVSRGLLDRLDDGELEGVLAHELAHLHGTGGGRLWLAWGLRALQATSPAALILFRRLADLRERACDDLAARVTGRPAALASALLTSHGLDQQTPHFGRVERARREVLRRARLIGLRGRVQALLATEPQRPRPLAAMAVTVVVLATVWGADRLAFGPVTPHGWQEARAIADLPAPVGHGVVPGYLPPGWQWPPPVVRYRLLPQPGWWLGTGPQGQPAVKLWLGSGPAPGPEELGPAQHCLTSACPQGWRAHRRTLQDGQVVWLLTDAVPQEAARIAEGLPATREGLAR